MLRDNAFSNHDYFNEKAEIKKMTDSKIRRIESMKQDELPITCEFPIENLQYTIHARKIGKDTILTFTNKFDRHDYFAISIRDNAIHIGTCGG